MSKEVPENRQVLKDRLLQREGSFEFTLNRAAKVLADRHQYIGIMPCWLVSTVPGAAAIRLCGLLEVRDGETDVVGNGGGSDNDSLIALSASPKRARKIEGTREERPCVESFNRDVRDNNITILGTA